MHRKKRENSREMELDGKIEQPLSSHATPPAPLNVRKLSNVRNLDGPIYISSPSAAAGEFVGVHHAFLVVEFE